MTGGSTSHTTAPPERLGKYQVLEPLGHGAMGVVYRGRDTVLHRDVALKLMAASIAGDATLQLRFEREARAAAQLAHPNVVTVYDLGYSADGSPYVAMELLKGEDLQHALARGLEMSFDRKLSIVVQVLAGLAPAHRAGIVHRDVKPANIFLAGTSVKLLDFGMARLLRGSATRSGGILGTLEYMAPEQLAGGAVDGRADVFSCGCVLYELLAGKPPFAASDLVTTIYRITQGSADFGLVADVDPHGATVAALRRSLARSPDQRHASAQVFALELISCLSPAGGEAGKRFLEELLRVNPDSSAAPRAIAGDARSPDVAPRSTIDLRATTADGARRASRVRQHVVLGGIMAGVGILALAYALLLPGPQALPDFRTVGSKTPLAAPSLPPDAAKRALAPRPSASHEMRPASAAPQLAAASPRTEDAPSEAATALPHGPTPTPAISGPIPQPTPTEAPSVLARSSSRLIVGQWLGYITDESCKKYGAVDDHWDCALVCMRKGYRPLFYTQGKLFSLVGVERISGNKNRKVLVNGTLDLETSTLTAAGGPLP